ncbi:uncharacterized protein LOC127653743 [Xyrauchen texanus]|uniref:uncharacterized protein LOC127653743 n=1 Tax=Xyrauchen texanus TaxID=154827 RepID=UPI00224295C9|nr:uncharacterized protein LOC127653743 [Xyrauchen texanus]
MDFAKFSLTASQQLVLRASDEAVAFIAAKRPRGTAAAARAKKPEEVEKEAQAHVVSKGGDPGNPMLVLGCHSIQFGKYQGQTFRWLLENDVGYTTQLVASHQREWEKSASDSPLMANKDALARYSCAHPAFAEQLRYHRVHEEARARATLPGCEGEALVGFGDYKEATLKDLYDSTEKKHQTFVKWLRRKTPQPGTSMDAARKYILGRDKERSAEAAATPPPPSSSSSTTTSSGPSKAAASTTLPPRKPIAPMFSALLGRRPMAPGELQTKVRKLMTTPARPAVPAVSTSVRDQRPSVPPPPPPTEVTDKELVQMATDLETAHVQVLQTLPLVVRPPSPPPPALSSIPPPPPRVAAAPPTLAVPARAPGLTREEPRRVSVKETPSGEATLAPAPAKRKRKERKVEQPATPTPASAESRLPESWRTALTVEEQEWIGRELFRTDSEGRSKLTTDLKLWTIRRVLDFDGWYLMVTEYLECRRCKRKVAAWSQEVVSQLGEGHRALFPAILTYKLACDRRVIIQLRERTLGNSATQLYKKLCEAHTEAWMRQSIHYLSVMEPFTSRGVVRMCTPPPKPPPVPQYAWLLMVYCHDILSRLEDMKARVTSVFGTVLKMHSTKKVTRKFAGAAAQTAAWATNVGNEHGQVLMSVLTDAEGAGLLSMAAGLMRRYRDAGVEPPQLLYVDRDCCSSHGGSKTADMFRKWDKLVVRLDIWHLMRRFASGVTTESHQLYKPFLQQLSSCIFLWDPEDAARLLNAKKRMLEAQGMTFSSDAGVWRHVSRKNMALHCRRRTLRSGGDGAADR